MANTFTAVLGKIFAQGLYALRENCVMPRLVNSDFSTEAKQQGNTIDIPIPSAASAVAITPAATAPDPPNLSPTTAQIVLDQWYEAAFQITDKEMNEIANVQGYRSRQVTEHIRVLANQINASIFALYPKAYGTVGTPGTTPFGADVSAATQARRLLGVQLAPMNPRFCVLDPDAEANALGLRAFQDASFRGDSAGIIEGQIGRKLGFQFAMDQVVPRHTTGAAGTPLLDDSAARPVGTKTLHMDGFTTKPSVGDVFTIAGDSQQYTVTASTTLVGTDSDVSFEPGLKVAIPAVDGSEPVTFLASHTVNLAGHRDAIGFASRVLAGDGQMTAAEAENVMQLADPVSGLTLRLERRREFYRTRYSFSVLWGVGMVRPEYIVRIAGE